MYNLTTKELNVVHGGNTVACGNKETMTCKCEPSTIGISAATDEISCNVKYEIEQNRVVSASCSSAIRCVLYSKVLPEGAIQYWCEKKV